SMRVSPSGIVAILTASLMSVAMSGCSMFGGPAAEEPLFAVVAEHDNIQVRDYEAYTIAETGVDEAYHTATEVSFNRLLDYISGANTGSSKIEMTAPVLVIPQGVSMISLSENTTPQPGQDSDILNKTRQGWTVAFVLPQGMNSLNSPAPADSRIKLVDVPERQVATLRFTGRLRTAPIEAHRSKLAGWLDKRRMNHQADWRVAGYNPPWTIPALRRNEIQVTLTHSN
ncbi:MAG: heme-binding protein, partial [Gammaproteobacteria bacterium]|nr:heme-binding protein [Gammaproteobacteria bacterium]